MVRNWGDESWTGVGTLVTGVGVSCPLSFEEKRNWTNRENKGPLSKIQIILPREVNEVFGRKKKLNTEQSSRSSNGLLKGKRLRMFGDILVGSSRCLSL